jgi:hypothetical protein
MTTASWPASPGGVEGPTLLRSLRHRLEFPSLLNDMHLVEEGSIVLHSITSPCIRPPTHPPTHPNHPPTSCRIYLSSLLRVGVEVGVHQGAFSGFFLKHWAGKKLHLVDPWERGGMYGVDRQHDFDLTMSRVSPFPGRYRLGGITLRCCTLTDSG